MGLFNKNPSDKKVKLKKTRTGKEFVEVKPKKISQKTANWIAVGFVTGMVGLSALTVVSNTIRATSNSESTVKPVESEKNSRNISNRVGIFMTGFLSQYFSDKDADTTKLNAYFGEGIDIKNTSLSKKNSRLTGAVLIEITDNLATYKVNYEVETDGTWNANVGVINIPYAEKDGKYYVSDLPYFTNEPPYTASGVKNRVALRNPDSDQEQYDKAKQYVEAFFKAYLSGDDTQMTPFTKNINSVVGYVFESLDYTYFVEKDNRIIVLAQITVKDGLDLTHQENFTLTLSKDENKDSFYVEKMQHGIVKKYMIEEKK